MLAELATDAVEVPALETFGFGVLVLARIASAAVAEQVFPEVAGGAVLTAALHEPRASFTSAPGTIAQIDREWVHISGAKVDVPFARIARWILVPVDCGVAVVQANAPGLRITDDLLPAVRRECSVWLDDVVIPREHLLPGGLAMMRDMAIASIAAVADGLLRGMVSLTVEEIQLLHRYAKSSRPNACSARSRYFSELCDLSDAMHQASQDATLAIAGSGDSWSSRPAIVCVDQVVSCLASRLSAAIAICRFLHGDANNSTGAVPHRHIRQLEGLAHCLGVDLLDPDLPLADWNW
ncbi:acyl-CoA dehydrogenase [Nocardia sp. CDC160]|uniref:acyl-CoA dehydrogenase n=1 Tax=Nocardia sp. CDC160 TaxID=3112166 RepID=UPI002DBD20C7|nr:acyl-CoA dehydrogenase [Nocardia sp. CDC160]MEC3919247.1 acyl-CoA dehydrogenase [Nocardia sp. CDC160]